MIKYSAKSLSELEKYDLGNNAMEILSADESSLIATCRDLYERPLNDLTIEDLRILIGQNIGLRFLLPLAIECLTENPLAEGDYYPGDLLSTVINVEPSFWVKYPTLYWQVCDICNSTLMSLKKLEPEIERLKLLEPRR